MDARLAGVGTDDQRATVLRFLRAAADSEALGEPVELLPRRHRSDLS